MPTTYLSLHYHILFSTRDREALIASTWRDELYAQMEAKVRELKGVAEEINGVADHVHLLLALRSSHRLADVVREVKRASAAWIHTEHHIPHFNWQEGYAAFTVSPHARDAARNYILHQHTYHETHSFTEELITLLEKAGVNYDPRHLE